MNRNQTTPRRYQVYFVLWGNSDHPTKNADAVFGTGAAAEAYAISRLPTMAKFVTSAEIYAVPGLAFVMTVKRAEPKPMTDTATDFNEPAQPDMFAARVDDLPLFSGTAKRQTSRPFVPEQAAHQIKLFGD
jgi:hypothetical protein